VSRLRIARPLPECRACESPVKRAVFIRNGGLCSLCLEIIGDTQIMGGLRPLVEPDDPTVYVERYLPPVPPARGQLPLPAACGCADPRDCPAPDPCDIPEGEQ
jgi:hypothetical protein